MKKTVQVYKETKRSSSILKAARLYTVLKMTFYHKIKGRQDQPLYPVLKQKLTPKEEKSIQKWVLEIQFWGFSPRVAQLREMVEELLQARHNFKELGKNWTKRFLNRHPVLQSKYSRTLD